MMAPKKTKVLSMVQQAGAPLHGRKGDHFVGANKKGVLSRLVDRFVGINNTIGGVLHGENG